ncbi:hypothetical protein [Amycolatopsis sp. PS_44_ISF1]|uniref:hypothetical protein n=1 Tax=Amycolatopsis sp. PS_44_ISF1 TaxID=2974917 RepID=UPI0028DE5156|nr:hypothetical protein [Amycolatopsis sp. PS_44_ISF1]MDT8909685.1 hypothetical protein [Amycolatopsis sp. PS_44_ISF1]
MSSEDALAAMRAKLSSLEAENTARSALLDRSREEAVAQSREKLEKQGKIQGAVFVRLQERNRRAKAAGGWATESTVGEKPGTERSFGFEDDDAGKDRRTGYRAPAEPGDRPAPPKTEPLPVPPGSGRHRREAANSDEADFADTDWLAT